jgi:hypothetical protein
MASALVKPAAFLSLPMGPAAAPLRQTWLSIQRLWARLRQPDVMAPLALAFAVRIAVMLVATAVVKWYFAARNPGKYAGLTFQDFWDRKDADWYLSIAEQGYNYSPTAASRANFFPLYPALVSVIGAVARALHSPEPYTVAGMAISWVTFAIAIVVFYQLALYKLNFNRQAAWGAILLLSVYPFSYYDGAVFTESVYLMLIAVAFLAVERRNWLLAAATAGVASAARPPGLILGACVALAYALMWLHHVRREGHWLRWDTLTLALVPIGYLSYALYCWITFGDPLAYQKTSAAGWRAGIQLDSLHVAWRLLRNPNTWAIVLHPKGGLNHAYLLLIIEMTYVLLTALWLIATPFVWRLLGAPYGIFLFVSILAPLIDFPGISSLGRYVGVVFPTFFLMSYVLRNHPRILYALSSVSFVALCFYASLFISGFGIS